MRYRGFAVCVAFSGCVVSGSGNPAARCDDARACAPEQICYRGFCVEDEAPWVDPVSNADAGSALNEFDGEDAAIPSQADASASSEPAPIDTPVEVVPDPEVAPVDASAPGADLYDAGVTRGPRGAGGEPPKGEAVLPCLDKCKHATPASRKCTKCIEDRFGQSLQQLCGNAGAGDDGDQEEWFETVLQPICLSLCTGSASRGCSVPTPACEGARCGGMP